jgi:hypothetical protein
MQGSEAKICGLERNQQRPLEDEVAPSGAAILHRGRREPCGPLSSGHAKVGR